MPALKFFKALVIHSDPASLAVINETLWAYNPLGIEDRDTSLAVFFDDGADTSFIHELLARLRAEGLIAYCTVDEQRLENRNWNEEWERSLNVIKASERFVIKPTVKQYTPAENEIVLVIDPKMSFGTGEHQTTKLMLTLLEGLNVTGKRVLDIGTGTGVLAIAAAKLGAAYALAIDNDEWCFENGLENVLLNDVATTVDIRTTVIDEVSENDFDIILANIQKNILLSIKEELVKRLASGGIVALSGLLQQDEHDIRHAYESLGLTFVNKLVLDDWIALLFQA
jgi:ribosomal protein L11 methyltransferase